MKNELLAGAATELWNTRMEVIRIHEDLEDDDGSLGQSYAVLEGKFTAAIDSLEDLARWVDETVERQAAAAGEIQAAVQCSLF